MKYFNLIYLLFFCFFLLSCSKQDSSAIQLEIQDDIEIANLEIQEISQEFDCEEYMVGVLFRIGYDFEKIQYLKDGKCGIWGNKYIYNYKELGLKVIFDDKWSLSFLNDLITPVLIKSGNKIIYNDDLWIEIIYNSGEFKDSYAIYKDRFENYCNGLLSSSDGKGWHQVICRKGRDYEVYYTTQVTGDNNYFLIVSYPPKYSPSDLGIMSEGFKIEIEDKEKIFKFKNNHSFYKVMKKAVKN